MPRRKKTQLKHIGSEPLDPTSSLNKYFLCECGRKYAKRVNLVNHLKRCNGHVKLIICHWCKLHFKNQANLATHAYHMHGDLSYRKVVSKDAKSKLELKCDVCDAKFQERWKLKYHIRRQHFNLWARIPHAAAKEVNQVWFEKVLNTNLVMEIKKTGVNTLVMKPLPSDAEVKIHDNNKTIDLRDEYPTGRRKTDVICKVCLKMVRKFDLKKHMTETHSDYTKHKCNNCNKTFKRSYIYLQHVCHKAKGRWNRKVNGFKKGPETSIKIANVSSLKPENG